jgi:hypothetical protein
MTDLYVGPEIIQHVLTPQTVTDLGKVACEISEYDNPCKYVQERMLDFLRTPVGHHVLDVSDTFTQPNGDQKGVFQSLAFIYGNLVAVDAIERSNPEPLTHLNRDVVRARKKRDIDIIKGLDLSRKITPEKVVSQSEVGLDSPELVNAFEDLEYELLPGSADYGYMLIGAGWLVYQTALSLRNKPKGPKR